MNVDDLDEWASLDQPFKQTPSKPQNKPFQNMVHSQNPPNQGVPKYNMQNPYGIQNVTPNPNQPSSSVNPNVSNTIQGSLNPSIKDMQKLINQMQTLIDQKQVVDSYMNQN